MISVSQYESPLGPITLAGDEEAVTGLWFQGQKYYGAGLPKEHKEEMTPVLELAKKWLTLYFEGIKPDFQVPVKLSGTPFRMEVWEILCRIPWGETISYKEIAEQIAKKHGRTSMSAQAVGGAVGHNPVSILVPCHRVLGSKKNLTGYAGGMEKKAALLNLEGVRTDYLQQETEENR